MTTQAKKGNETSPVSKDYKLDDELETNVDNVETVDRTVVVNGESVMKVILLESIKKMITNYNYVGALALAREGEQLFNNNLVELTLAIGVLKKEK